MDAKTTQQLNSFENLLAFQPTWAWLKFLWLPHRVISLFTGNQALKTASCTNSYVIRILGRHPIPKKNVTYFRCPNFEEHDWQTRDFEGVRLNVYHKGEYNVVTRPKNNRCTVCGEHLEIPKRRTRVFRFCSEVLPGEKETVGEGAEGQSIEVKNAVYPEFKKWLPSFLIKKDITVRKPVMTLYDPLAGMDFGGLKYEGGDIIIEFVSYSQDVQAGAGVQRLGCFFDEEPPYDFYEEQLPRLLAEDGDVLFSLTPANKLSWAFDEIFEKAALYVRTQCIVDFIEKQDKKKVPLVETTDSERDIAVIQAATDDNPTLDLKVIESTYMWDDPDTIATRRYGIFKQATGRIFKDMNYKIHVIDIRKYLPQGVAPEWVHARSIDYHERNPWAIPWVALSPYNEAFLYQEFNPSPDNWVNLAIAQEVGRRSGLQKYVMNLIDPLACKIQTNTGISTLEDLNRIFWQLRKDGECEGGLWEPFDTKGQVGRDAIKSRLHNAVLCGRPFNNEVIENGVKKRLPTLWIDRECREAAKSLKQWRYDDYANNRSLVNKDKKETPAQKFSHFCTALEAVFKDHRFKPRQVRPPVNRVTPKYFQSERL